MNLYEDMSYRHFGPYPTRGFSEDQVEDDPAAFEIGDWPRALFIPLGCEEDFETDFGPPGNTNTELGSSSLTIFRESPESENIPAEDDYIWFNLPPGFPNEAELHSLYPAEKLRAAAKFVRDLQIVTANHMGEMFRKEVLFPCSLTEFDFPGPANPLYVVKNLKTVANLILGVESILKETLDIQMINEPHVEEPDYFACWPLLHTGIYLSKLISRYSLIKMVDTTRDVEIADYCLAMHERYDPRELMFDDGNGMTINRNQLSSLDLGRFVEPCVVNAYARVCNSTWNYYGITVRTTMDVVRKDFPRRSDEEQVDHWMRWVQNCSIDMCKVELVTIPLNVGDQFALLVVDFRRQSIQVIDTVYRHDRPSWDEFASDTVRSFEKLLHRVGDPRSVYVNDYFFSVFNTPWSSSSIDPESGMVAMYLMQVIGDENYPFHSMGITEEFVRIRIRLAMCAALMSSLINKEADRVLLNVSAFILEKITGQLNPSMALNEWMSIYNYFVRFNPVVFI